VGYLLYSTVFRLRRGRSPTGAEAAVLAVGTQFPDLVDKPLSWSLGLLPAGRSLAHSLLAVAAVSVVVRFATRRFDRPTLSFAFSLGYLTHPLVDGFKPLLAGDFQYVAYLFWPLFGYRLPHYTGFRIVIFEPLEPLLGLEPTDLNMTLYFAVQAALFAAAFAVWLVDGAPFPALPGRERRRSEPRR
jgi:hypothetical protein